MIIQIDTETFCHRELLQIHVEEENLKKRIWDTYGSINDMPEDIKNRFLSLSYSTEKSGDLLGIALLHMAKQQVNDNA